MAETEIEVTWGHAVRIWWAMVWRAVLFGSILGFVLGFSIGIVGAMLGVGKESLSGVMTILVLLTGIPLGIWVLKIVLKKNFGKFRIAILASDDAS